MKMLNTNFCAAVTKQSEEDLKNPSDSVYFADPISLSLAFTPMPSSREGAYSYA